jgi:hypothetical protein
MLEKRADLEFLVFLKLRMEYFPNDCLKALRTLAE